VSASVKLGAACNNLLDEEVMKKSTYTTVVIAFLASFALLFTGCEQSGPFEDAGEGIDETVDDAGDEIDDATD
jgi:hypothetical protein